MKYAVCSIFDIKGTVFSQPFYAPTIMHAVRSFLDAVRAEDPNNLMQRHPEDFQLYHLGAFNDLDGVFEADVKRHVVAEGREAFPPVEK